MSDFLTVHTQEGDPLLRHRAGQVGQQAQEFGGEKPGAVRLMMEGRGAEGRGEELRGFTIIGEERGLPDLRVMRNRRGLQIVAIGADWCRMIAPRRGLHRGSLPLVGAAEALLGALEERWATAAAIQTGEGL